MREAEKKGTVVLLQNLDPTYTSDEVEDIVYSALNQQCEARMIERTSVTIPHIGEALVIFKTREVAERVIRRLDEGCLLLSSGR
jgi:DNA-directed RNA polymerase subunit E'/Rpb7